MATTAGLAVISGFTFANLGPLTTTFTVPWSCAATDRVEYGWVNEGGLDIFHQGDSQCTKSKYPECYPSATTTVTATTTYDSVWDEWSGVGGYYSPGLYCPSGWATVGMAAVNDKKDITTSGIMSYSTTTDWMPFVYPPTLLASLLEPSQTLAICCPSSMTADISGGCYSTIPDQQPTVGCNVWVSTEREYETSVMPWTKYDDTLTTGLVRFITGTTTMTTTAVQTYDEGYEDFMTAISYVSQVTLIHHESDFHATAAGTGTGTGAQITGSASGSGSSESSATETIAATSTSNSARSLTRTPCKWDGVGAILSIVAGAMALGFAMIFTF